MGRLLSTALLVWLGEIQLRDLHGPSDIVQDIELDPGIESALVFFPVLFLASAALHYLIERPCRTLLSGHSKLLAAVKTPA